MSTLVEVLNQKQAKDKVTSGKVTRQVGKDRYLIESAGYTTVVTSHVGSLRRGELISVMKIGDASAAINSRGMTGLSKSQWMEDKPGYGRVDVSASDPNNINIENVTSVGRTFYIDG